jgi:hypothetical protein
MAIQDGLPQNLIQYNISNLLCFWITVGDPVLIIDKDDPLFHGAKNGF